MADLEKLNIVIEGQADKAVSALDKLIAKLREVKEAMSDLGASGSIRISIREYTDSQRELEETVRRQRATFADAKKTVKQYYDTLSKLVKTNNDVFLDDGHYYSESGAWDSLASTLNWVRDAYENVKYAKEEISEHQNAELFDYEQEQYRSFAVLLDEVAAKIPMVEAVAKVNEEVSGSLNGVAVEEERTAEQAEEVAEATENMSASLKEAGNSADEAGKKFSFANTKLGKLLQRFKNIATLRLMRWTIRQIVNAAKEGLEILTEWDRTFGNNTSYAAKTVDELSAKWREVKKAVGAALMPLIQIVQPILNWVMDAVINIFNALNQILRSAQGFSTYMKATYISTKATTESAKELKRVLFGFDELNVLNGNGGTGAAGSVSPIEFDETKVASFWSKIGKWLKEFTDSFKTKIKEIWGNITAAWERSKEAWGEVKANLKEIGEKISEWWNTKIATPIKDAWAEVKANFEAIGGWIAKNIELPIKQVTARYYEWLLTKHPKLAKFLGISQDDLNQIKVEIDSITHLDDNSKALLGSSVVEGAASGGMAQYKVKFNTDTTISPDTQRLLNLLKVAQAGLSVNAGGTNIKFNLIGGGIASNILFAHGGDPDMGTLFWAGEAGAEVVANTPSGTGVMNMKQMQDAVSNGNVQVVNAIGAMANAVVGAINSKDTNAYLDGQKITETVLRRANGMARATGQPVLVR